ncbi:penicillin acylase family protein [Telluribacter sp. SYSU D00476]|uniref:penicillin acylase family protein n=1 Tax=Telluribacter sp. SYSU D00476 TaxID=2811430 RepID=UPI001FF513D3|nr:penicillin acylase family protein [Telluribacter sp. SYSU D00476]
MKIVKAFLSLIIAAGLVYALSRPWGPVPALGPFISPYTGFWQNGEVLHSDDTTLVELSLDSLREEVAIRYDDIGVPHIFAKNNYDLYYAQGYVTARDRLWQMDLQTRAAAGRLSEVLGPATLEMDRRNRRLGLGYGAEANLKVIMSHPQSREAMVAYAAGVNEYIRQLAPKDYPVEFKLLGYAPEPWGPIKSMLMLEQMTQTLAGGADDLRMTNILKRYGQAVVDDLFPNYPVFQESPIIPEGTPWDFKPLPLPAAPKPDAPIDSSIIVDKSLVSEPPVEGLGSNNWAIGAEKSVTGYPILANDPHLELTLPSIWYQVQLSGPDVNVYGVSLPGIPSVIIGFNKNVAWGVTNVDADVMDLYEVKFRDTTRAAYWHDNQWKETRKREEVIRVKGQADVREEVVYTHHGPVAFYKGEYHKGPTMAVKWIGHEPGNSFLTFHSLNRASNYDDYRQALTHYVGPAQNFVFADNSKNIAITVNGKFPLKWKQQGKFLLDGSNPAHDWKGWIPMEQNPHVKNPPRGFVSSANQSSVDPTYPYYINWRQAPSERGVRINERLQTMTQATGDSLRLLQNDNFNVLARNILPTLLTYVKAVSLNSAQKAAVKLLEQWDYQNEPTSVAASIFEEWHPTLADAIWKDEFTSDTLFMRYPTRDRTLYMLLNQPDAPWFDNVKTPARETIRDVVAGSFKAAMDTLTIHHGPMGTKWQWALVKDTEIRHLTRMLKPFNTLPIRNGGGGSIVNATSKHHGPSWRMVVELGPEPKAYGIYPGGQSGNPGSPYYLNLLDTWEKGELKELVYLQSPDQSHPRLTSKVVMKKN